MSSGARFNGRFPEARRLWRWWRRRGGCPCRSSPARGARRFPDRRSRAPPCARRVMERISLAENICVELFRVVHGVQLGAAHQRDAAADEVGVEVAVGKGGAVGGDRADPRLENHGALTGASLICTGHWESWLGALPATCRDAPSGARSAAGAGAGAGVGRGGFGGPARRPRRKRRLRAPQRRWRPVGQAGRQSPRPSQ